jgi:hypothetical protein
MSLDRAKRDIERFSQGDWAVDITVNNLTGVEQTVRGFASKHHLSVDPETGLPVNSKNTHCSIHESVLVDAGFTVRNTDNEVDIKGWRVSYADSSGLMREYLIDDGMPDETLGLIVCFLGDYGTN